MVRQATISKDIKIYKYISFSEFPGLSIMVHVVHTYLKLPHLVLRSTGACSGKHLWVPLLDRGLEGLDQRASRVPSNPHLSVLLGYGGTSPLW